MGVGYDEAMKPDPYCGWSLRPNAVQWDCGIRQFLRINSDGMRDREHDRDKPAGSWRLAVLGDSFAQGREANLEEIFPRVLERRLSDCSTLATRNPEVINFGVSAYGTAQELLTLQHRAWSYDPDAILLEFYDGNDVADNYPELANDRDVRPFFRFSQDERMVADFGFRDSARYRSESTRLGGMRTRLKSQLRIWQLASRAALLLRTAWLQPHYKLLHSREFGVVPGALVPPQDVHWSNAWKITEGILLLMREEVRARGRQFFVFTASAPIQVDPDPNRRREEAQALGVPDLLYPEKRLAGFAARNGIIFFPLIEEMQKVAQREQIYLHGLEGSGDRFFHWNGQGHALAAEILAGRICETLGGDLLPRPWKLTRVGTIRRASAFRQSASSASPPATGGN
jgi:hypothetical protein